MIRIEQGNATELDPALIAQHCQVMITDPPYSRRVHTNAVSQSRKGGYRRREFGFAHLNPPTRRWLGRVAAALPRWSVMYSDVEHSGYLRISGLAAGARYIRTIPWVRWSMPQLTGTMPPQGFEHVLCFHGPREKLRWNGPGNLLELSPLNDKCLRGEDKHRAQKPLSQALTLVSYFSDVGETIFEPMAGSGTTALACALLGRNCYAVEAQEDWCQIARRRIEEPLSARDLESVEAWLSAADEGAHTKKAEARRRVRAADRERVRKAIKKD